MFPPGGSEGIDMGQLLQQAQRMQAELMSAQQDLADSEVTGSAGGGLVRATMTGGGELTGLQIDPSVVDPDDTETLSDLVVAAVRDAHAEIQRMATEQLGSINSGVEGLLGGSGGIEGLLSGAPQELSSPEDEDDEPDDDTPPGSRG
ncbi:YbaB/EbfC family nucleoid-associated protein [Phytoactinopolyspora endophytica]|uniref:YbaB/EbfC family nucleoid-associated protein n=1 Tax=Phytoactinopolyspora endophytica TaxID=1642495 RepID=UPI00101CBB63|nr:YbaB/EbfC family nucleoid-associated protein [Phytoactinopolyspora endophytica]